MDDISRAQRWHDTDHGKDRWSRKRPPPGVKWRRPIPKRIEELLFKESGCFCCCGECDPDFGERPNPFWTRAWPGF